MSNIALTAFFSIFLSCWFKGGYLELSHLAELINIYLTEIYMGEKKYKSPITKKHKIKKIITIFLIMFT